MPMEWIRSHTYASALAAASLAVVLGGILVATHATIPTTVGITAWSGNSAALEPATTPTTQVVGSQTMPSALATEQYGTQTLPYTSNTPVMDSQGTIETNSGNSYDFNALMAELSNPSLKSGTSASSSTGQSAVNAWSFIPSTLISIKDASSGRTDIQQAIYQYGNEVGSLVMGYDASHGNQTQILSDANNDRHNAAKQAGVERIGQDLETVGEGLAEITDTPTALQAANTALSNSYIDIGKKLVAVGQAEPLKDSELVAAIQSYDSAVTAFNNTYVMLANLFSSYGVTFSSGDPGSVFSFSPSAL